MNNQTKKCTTCQIDKPLEEFSKKKQASLVELQNVNVVLPSIMQNTEKKYLQRKPSIMQNMQKK